jgi:hypothetical protein
MPPAKKPAARRATRTAAAPSPTSPITRKEVEQAAARFDKALDEANDALLALGQDMSKGARSAYKEIAKALRSLRRDAQKTNRSLLKDLEKLRASVTPGKAPSRSTSKGTAAKAPARTAAKTAAKAPARTATKTTATKARASRATR